MALIPPPPILDSAKLISFASTNAEGIEFTDRIELHVGRDGEFERVGRVPRLAIAETYPHPGDILLMFCDENWESIGVIAFTSVEEAKRKAERGYKGVSRFWEQSPYSAEDEATYLRDEYNLDPNSEWWKTVCSFCGNSKNLGTIVEGPRATICQGCIETFYEKIHNESSA